MKAGIIATGTELLLGETFNTSVFYLTRELSRMGIEVDCHITVGDHRERIKRTLKEALKHLDLIITTGGTGQTADDLTKESVAEVLGLKMELNQESLGRIQTFFAERQAPMPEIDKKQAYIPEGSQVLLNDLGTAPGAIISRQGKMIVILPGPPNELERMFERYVRPELDKILNHNTRTVVRVLKVFGLRETAVEKVIEDLYQWNNLSITLLAKMTEIHIRLETRNGLDAEEILDEAEKILRQRLGDAVFARDNQTMTQIVADELKRRKLTIGTAESCTGGLLGGALTEEPGSSAFFMGGIVSYANDVKKSLLGVEDSTLNSVGAVSPEVAVQMAQGVRQALGVDLGLATTGIAGPDGGSKEKPVGLVYIALASPHGSHAEKFQFLGDRKTVRSLTVMAALNMLRLYLIKGDKTR